MACTEFNCFLNFGGELAKPILFTHFFYKQPHFRVEPRVAMKLLKMRLKVAMKLLSIFGIEAEVAKLNVWKTSKNWQN